MNVSMGLMSARAAQLQKAELGERMGEQTELTAR